MLAECILPVAPVESRWIDASVFDIFKIGVGPSSSHTMGPMTVAADFVGDMTLARSLPRVSRILVTLYGSLALTGMGHATDRAILLGLSGERPATLDPDAADEIVSNARQTKTVRLGGLRSIEFDEGSDLVFKRRERLAFHSNAMRLQAFEVGGAEVENRLFYSIGGGAITDDSAACDDLSVSDPERAPLAFRSAAELLEVAECADLSIAETAWTNECRSIGALAVGEGLAHIRAAMDACIDRGLGGGGVLPGGLRVRRRAKDMASTIIQREAEGLTDPLSALDWVTVWALAVNEENAAGGRVVTAPTNGAAGIVPAVLRYYATFVPGATERGQDEFLLAAAAIGSLFKRNASISGAEVGCQGEIGVACSMAAAGLAAAMGATNRQVENAAEIGMEHNLGLTCDPVGGLVQVPCIERNAIGAVKAIEAARLAMLGDGDHRVSLDQVIETMRRTGADMSERYKETSLGGLAVNVVEC